MRPSILAACVLMTTRYAGEHIIRCGTASCAKWAIRSSAFVWREAEATLIYFFRRFDL